MSKGKLTYLHQVSTTNIEGDNVIVHEESVSKGPNGLAFKYYHKDNKKKEKILARQEQDGTFTLVTIVNDKKDEKKELTKEQLLKENTNLKLRIEQLETQIKNLTDQNIELQSKEKDYKKKLKIFLL